jgi:hypothetical protein
MANQVLTMAWIVVLNLERIRINFVTLRAHQTVNPFQGVTEAAAVSP